MSLIREREFFHHEDEKSSEVNCVFIYCTSNESRRVAIGLFDLGGGPKWKTLPVKKRHSLLGRASVYEVFFCVLVNAKKDRKEHVV